MTDYSLLKQVFFEKLANKDIKIVSFDIFDTLVFRKCGHYEKVFDELGEKKEIKKVFESAENFKNYRIEAEKQARIKSKEEEVTLKQIYSQLPLSRKKQKKFLKLELLVENEMIIINYQIQNWIDLAHKMGKKIILTSDMYLSKKQIKKLVLSKLDNSEKISKIFISSNTKKTKASGSLFLHVKEKLEVDFSNIFHIGDNERSDVKIPKDLGITCLYYGFNSDEKQSLSHESSYIQTINCKALHVRNLSILQNPYKDELKNFYYFLGSSIFAPLLWEFSHFLADIVKNHDISSLNFLTREGIIFEKYFKKLYPNIQTNILYASRTSTFFLDIKDLSDFDIAAYKSLKIEEFYKSLFLEINNKNIKINKDKPLEKSKNIVCGDQRLLDIILKDIDKRKKKIRLNFKNQAKFLHQYLKDKNTDTNSALVDFGGRGTTVKRLICNFFDPKKTKSILMFKYLNGYSKAHKILEFTFFQDFDNPQGVYKALKHTHEFFEIILNLDNKTCVSYEKENNKIKPILHLPNCNKKTIKNIKTSLFCGIDTFFKNAIFYNVEKNSFSKSFVSSFIARLINYPTLKEADYLGCLEYDEGKSSEFIYTIIDDNYINKSDNYKLYELYANFTKNPDKYKNKIPWIQGMISKKDPDFFSKFYGIKPTYLKDKINKIIKELKEKNINKINIYGAGEIFMQFYPILKYHNITIDKVIDKRASFKPFSVLSHEVTTLENALNTSKVKDILICSNAFKDEIMQDIKKINNSLNIIS